jgi:glycerophosphoryl diester phosphodiesterase
LNRPLIIAHRGFSGIAPENTLPAFKYAAALGVDLIELDIHQTKDGIIVCHHDEDVSKLTGRTEFIKDLTLDEIQTIDAGAWFDDKFKGEKIPTLTQVLELGIPLLIEIKKGEDFYPGIIQNLMNLLQNYPHSEKCILQSFDASVLESVSSISDKYKLQKLVSSEIPLFSAFDFNGNDKNYDGINPDFSTITKEFLNHIHQIGKTSFTYTVNESEDMLRLISLGIDGIITDFPDKLLSLLNENSEAKK